MTQMDMLRYGVRVFAFFGEAGSGKSENALNWAIRLSSLTERPIHFFDLDQTKFIYRSQDCEELLKERGIALHHSPPHLDSPLVAPGITGLLTEQEYVCVLDIGGGSAGATIVAQFSQYLSGQGCRTFYVLNPYRPFMRTRERVLTSISGLASIAGLDHIEVIANPCIGNKTTLEDVLLGLRRCDEMLSDSDYRISMLSTSDKLISVVRGHTSLELVPLHFYVRYA